MDFLGGLFTVLIIFVIGFWLLALLVPTFLRFWIGRKVDAFQRQFNQEMKEEQRNTPLPIILGKQVILNNPKRKKL